MSNYMTQEQAVEIYGEKVVRIRKELNEYYGGNTFSYEYVGKYVKEWDETTKEILEKAKKGYKLYD